MSLRRARIKAVANLPVRRKVNTESQSLANDVTTETNNENSPQEITADSDSLIHPAPCINNNIEINDLKKHELISSSKEAPTQLQEGEIKTSETKLRNDKNSYSVSTNDSDTTKENENSTNINPSVAKESQRLQSRRITKPVINRRLLQTPTQKPVPQTIVLLSPDASSTPNTIINDITPTNKDTLNKVHTVPGIDPLVNCNKTSLSECDNNDVLEVSLNPPASPTKNRQRIKPTPRLNHRRSGIHGNASESEDESRNTPSSRNISSQSLDASPPLTKITRSVVIPKRTVRRTEVSKKLAEARKSFIGKYGSNTPERSQLTVFDMIYYNPSANPIKRDDNIVEEERTIDDPKGVEEVERAQDEQSNEATDAGTEETSMPVPQIKIGPSGEIILDEQSLVIETTGTQKGRAEIANSHLVYDDGNTNYGIYKKRRRPKDWSVNETLRFYKALSTVGTDFSMMSSLFEGRSRRDLKLKFKKEEKINLTLLNKVLCNPHQFDLLSLEEELKRVEINHVKKKDKPPKAEVIKKVVEKKPRPRRKRHAKLLEIVSSDVVSDSDDSNEDNVQSSQSKEILLNPVDDEHLREINKIKINTTNGIVNESTYVQQVNTDSLQFSNMFTEHDNTNLTSTPKPLNKRVLEDLNIKVSNKKLKICDNDIEKDCNAFTIIKSVEDRQHNLTEIDEYIKENNTASNSTKKNNSDGTDISDITELDNLNLTVNDSILNISNLDDDTNVRESLSTNNLIILSTNDSNKNDMANNAINSLNDVQQLPFIQCGATIENIPLNSDLSNRNDKQNSISFVNEISDVNILNTGNGIITLPFSDMPVNTSQLNITDLTNNYNMDCAKLSSAGTEKYNLDNSIKLVDTPVNNFVVLSVPEVSESMELHDNSLTFASCDKNLSEKNLAIRPHSDRISLHENALDCSGKETEINKNKGKSIPDEKTSISRLVDIPKHKTSNRNLDAPEIVGETNKSPTKYTYSYFKKAFDIPKKIFRRTSDKPKKNTHTNGNVISNLSILSFVPKKKVINSSEPKNDSLSSSGMNENLPAQDLLTSTTSEIQKNNANSNSPGSSFRRFNIDSAKRNALESASSRESESLARMSIKEIEWPVVAYDRITVPESQNNTIVLSSEDEECNAIIDSSLPENLSSENNKNLEKNTEVQSVVTSSPQQVSTSSEDTQEGLSKETQSEKLSNTNVISNIDEILFDFPELHDDSVELGALVIKTVETSSDVQYMAFRKSVANAAVFMEKLNMSNDQLRSIVDSMKVMNSKDES